MDQLDFAAVEAEICRLPNVSVTRIVTEGERITEVHVVASPGKQPKQIVRDVQSVAMATFGLELDHRTISVVQLGTNGDRGTADPDYGDATLATRVTLDTVVTELTGLRASVTVTLHRGETEVAGSSDGSSADATHARLVAAATIDALRRIEPAAAAVDVDHATVVRVGASDVAVVTLVYLQPPAEYLISGSAIVRRDRVTDAIARAVLDATNRRISHTAVPA